MASHHKAMALELRLHLLEVIQAPKDLGPFPAEAFVFHADFQLTLENQGQEAAKDVATDGFIALVINGAGFQDGLCRAEGVLDHPKHFVNSSDGFRVVLRVGAQHEETVVAFFLGDLFVVNCEVAAALNLQEPAIAFISNETLVPATQLLAQGLEDAGAIVRILSSLFFIEAHNVTAALDFDLLDLERSRVFGPSVSSDCLTELLLKMRDLMDRPNSEG